MSRHRDTGGRPAGPGARGGAGQRALTGTGFGGGAHGPERAGVMSVRHRECTTRHFPVCLRPPDGVTVTSGEVHDTEEERACHARATGGSGLLRGVHGGVTGVGWTPG